MTTPPEPTTVDDVPPHLGCPAARPIPQIPFVERCTRRAGHDGPCESKTGIKWAQIIDFMGVPIPEYLLPNWDRPEAAHWRAGVADTIRHYEGN